MFIKKSFAVIFVFLAVATSEAYADLPFYKELAGTKELPKTYGVGVDLLHLNQDYNVQNIDIGLPGFVVSDTSVLSVESEIDHVDVKIDAWIFPFLNVFAIAGALEGNTQVDLSGIELPQLAVPLGIVDIEYDGSVFGVGLTSVYGQEDWFVSLTATYTDTSLDGDFTSSVNSLSLQPRYGRKFGKATWWIGATYLDTDEEHSGIIALGVPGLPALPFEVELKSADRLNLNLGVLWQFNDSLEASIEGGASDREHVLANLTARF